MKELIVIIDISGSMYAMGKASVVGNVLSTLSALDNLGDENESLAITKMQWDGTCADFEKLIEKCSGKNVLLLTDGYALTDNCKTSGTVKSFLEQNCMNFFVVLCGGDAMKISAAKEFRRVRNVSADNILFALEALSWSNGNNKFADKEENWE